MKIFSKKALISVLSLLLVAVSAGAVFQMNGSASVVILQDTDPELKKAHYVSGKHYEGNTDYTETGGEQKTYNIKTNMYTVWEDKDDVDFFYKEYAFNYDKTTTLTFETTLSSWSGAIKTAGAGIMLRTGLGISDPTIFYHARPEGLMVLIREQKNNGYEMVYRTPLTNVTYPLQIKVVIKNQKVTFWYKAANASWSKYTKTGNFKYAENGNKIYAGFAANSSAESNTETAVFNGYNVLIEGAHASSNSSEVDSAAPSVPENPFPQDPVIEQSDVLLYETFSDNDIFNGEGTVTDPKWEHRGLSDVSECIVTNDSYTDRYLETFDFNQDFLLVGDETWSDYSASANIKFAENIEPVSTFFGMSVRFTSIESNGYAGYCVMLKDGKNVGIYKMQNAATFYNKFTLVSELYDLSYLTAQSTATEHNLKIDAFDNTITVYWDGVAILDYTDDGDVVNSFGRVGFISNGTTAQIDEVKVVKLQDLVNGDFDNQIGGNWDTPIPDYLKPYLKNPNNY